MSQRNNQPTRARPRVAVILAAGKGTRLRSALPKVLHPVAGKTMLEWVIAAARGADCERLYVVVGHGVEQVRQTVCGEDLTWVLQRQPKGTGDALAQVEPILEAEATVLVLSGDVPLVQPKTLVELVNTTTECWGSMAVAQVKDPGVLGRVVPRDGDRLDRIVEAADASPEELRLNLINAGLYALPAPEIFPYLHRLRPDNAKGELYLTDALNAAAADGHSIRLVSLADSAEALGVNDRRDLARVHRTLLERKADELMAAGVTLLDPSRVVIEAEVHLSKDTVIHPSVSLLGRTTVGSGCVLHQGVWLRDTTLGDQVTVEPYSVLDGAWVGDRCRIGPFARLRAASVLHQEARVGNFVEVKNSRLGSGTKANHLAYLGDATLGEKVNIGAGTVTCNYDGQEKHATEIGDGAFIGSDTMLVAPVKVGARATTAAGSVITREVPEEALGISRAAQRILLGWARRRRKRPKR